MTGRCDPRTAGAESYRDYILRLVDSAPPATDRLKAELRALLLPVVRTEHPLAEVTSA